MSAELIDQSPNPIIDSRVSDAEMEFAEQGEGGLAVRFRNARKMLEAFHNSGTPDEVVHALSLTTEEFYTAIDDAQSLYDNLALHVVPFREAPAIVALVPEETPPANIEPASSDMSDKAPLIIVAEQNLEPELTKQQLVDVFSNMDAHESSITFRQSFERLLSLSKEGGTSRAAEAAKFLRDCLPEIVEHGRLDEGELPRELFTGDVFSNEERQRLFMLIGIRSNRRGTGQRIATIKNPVVLGDIRKNAQSGRHNVDEAEANVISALNVIVRRLNTVINP